MKLTRIAFFVCGFSTIFLAACSSGETTTTTATSTTTSANTTPSTVTPTPTTVSSSVAVTLKHVPTGTASLNWDGTTQKLSVKLALSGLAPNSSHPVHIHKGSCAQQGPVLQGLQPVVTDAAGNGTSTTSIANFTAGITGPGLYINVHNGPGLTTDDQMLSIACGDIANVTTSLTGLQLAEIRLNAPSGVVGQTTVGNAQLTLTGNVLTVHIQLSGLEPNTKHPAHIHAGSCTNQGKVIYPLKAVLADAQGNVDVVTQIGGVTAIPTTGWYINVHHNTNLASQTGFDPIACGNVTG